MHVTDEMPTTRDHRTMATVITATRAELHAPRWGTRAVGVAAVVLLTAACSGGAEEPAASPVPSATTSGPSSTPSPSSTPTNTSLPVEGVLPTGTFDTAGAALLAERAGQEGSISSTTSGGEGGDLGVLVSSPDGVGTTVELLTFDSPSPSPQWRTEVTLTLPEPLLAQRTGGPVEWRRLTDGGPDLVVYVQGGTLTGGIDAAVAQRTDDGWRWVPRQVEDETDGVPELLGNPVFDAGDVFATRATAGQQVVAQYWVYDEDSAEFVPTDRPA